ncbi:MAG TPA: ABC transporter permease [Spirochaetia bacterium]|nr:ABC transporter permease [Spirochaetales bacterium]HRY79749.1 ABC transporter permease [Spirochaetia bacterium]
MKAAGNASTGDWDIVITAKDKLLSFDFKELFQYRDLIKLLIRRDFVAVYKQTILGPLWFLFHPIMSTIVYMFVFGNIAKIGTDNIPRPLFYFSGTMLWTFFATTLQKSSDTFIVNAPIYGKVYFPRFSMPIVYAVNSFFTLAIQFVCLLAIYVVYLVSGYSFHPSWWLLATPILVLQTALLSLGIGIMVSALTTRYRDFRNLIHFGLQMMMYVTPVVYPMSEVPARLKPLVMLNPLTPVMELFRHALLGGGEGNLTLWAVSLVETAAVFWLGMRVFNHNERTFIDVV